MPRETVQHMIERSAKIRGRCDVGQPQRVAKAKDGDEENESRRKQERPATR